jgi:Protein of unknown function (DUF2970)
MRENQMATKKSGMLATFKAVAWSFFGIRKGADHESDMANLNPVYVILAGIISCVLFVLTLIAVVKYVLI